MVALTVHVVNYKIIAAMTLVIDFARLFWARSNASGRDRSNDLHISAPEYQIYLKYDIRSNWRSKGKGFLATTIIFI